jgi:UDP-4-amino-4,6-dideoxy-N-acetyl-beta-L-altrosamine N-acetyltransferase
MQSPICFSRYGITLRELQLDEIELVRQWRNDPKIAALMLDQTYITEDMQKKWFDRISQSDSQYYFLAWFKDHPIGVASLIKIDRAPQTCEPGMYIYVDEYRNNIVPFCVAFALNDLAFDLFNLQTLYGKIFADNAASVRFHEACGYTKYDDLVDGLGLYSLNHTDYLVARNKISRFIRY